MLVKNFGKLKFIVIYQAFLTSKDLISLLSGNIITLAWKIQATKWCVCLSICQSIILDFLNVDYSLIGIRPLIVFPVPLLVTSCNHSPYLPCVWICICRRKSIIVSLLKIFIEHLLWYRCFLGTKDPMLRILDGLGPCPQGTYISVGKTEHEMQINEKISST